MPLSKEDLHRRMSDSVVNMDEDAVAENCSAYIAAGYPALDGIMAGIVDGMNRAGQLYEDEEYFVTDILLCSDVMYEGLGILRPHLPPSEAGKSNPVGIIGVVEGDTHDIGKNLVKIMLETAGFDMVDLGRDVPLQQFVDQAYERGAAFVCLSTLMTTTMPGMEMVVKLLKEKGIREEVKVVIGGGPISQKFSDAIGADGYSANAVEAVKLVKGLLNIA